MKILAIHNYYQNAGGEDTVFFSETNLLRDFGHEVIEYVDYNDRINELGTLKSAKEMIWSSQTKMKLTNIIRQQQPDIAHFHNTFLLISPAAYQACQAEGVPVIQTLHNYRLLCPAATFYREGKVCEQCINTFMPWPSIQHQCYRQSFIQSGGLTTMLMVHRLLKTWVNQVDLYIALTEFSRQKFIEGGIPANKIQVKPNFAYPDPGYIQEKGDYGLFVGRLSTEKGILTLLEAWQHLGEYPLKIVGDGELKEQVISKILEYGLHSVEFLGPQPREKVFGLMQKAQFLAFPSEWYEGFPMTIVEAFACGTPVVGPALGSMSEIIVNKETGLLFQSGNLEDLVEKLKWAFENSGIMAKLGYQARREFEQHYTPNKNYEALINIYKEQRRLKIAEME